MNGKGDDEGRLRKLRGSRRGVLTIVAIFVAGGVFVAGLYIAAMRGVPEEYRSAQVGTPNRTLRVASMDLGYERSGTHRVIDAIYKLKPDFVMLQRVTRHDAHEMAQALELRHGGTVQMFYSLNDPLTQEHPGNAVLAKWPLYRGRTMVKGHPRHFGIFVESVVEGKRFLLGSWELSADAEAARREVELMTESRTRGGMLPLVIGGTGGKGMADGPLKPVTSDANLCVSDEWGVLETGAVKIDGMPELVWADVRGK